MKEMEDTKNRGNSKSLIQIKRRIIILLYLSGEAFPVGHEDPIKI